MDWSLSRLSDRDTYSDPSTVATWGFRPTFPRPPTLQGKTCSHIFPPPNYVNFKSSVSLKTAIFRKNTVPKRLGCDVWAVPGSQHLLFPYKPHCSPTGVLKGLLLILHPHSQGPLFSQEASKSRSNKNRI